MDIDDDLTWAWPYWKFGMKRDDLTTKLHDQYNTVPSSIQDPTAFHHDVYEIAKIASTAQEFHSLLSVRREQRLHELNDALETASLHIISNPSLISSERWALAVNLFRNRSLDTLVRYFASYLPEEDAGRLVQHERGACGVSSSYDEARSLASSAPSLSASSYTHSVADTVSTVASAVHTDEHPFFPAEEDSKPLLTHEPLTMGSGILARHDLPHASSPVQSAASPLTQLAEGLAQASCGIDDDRRHRDLVVDGVLTPPRTASCSGSDLDVSEPEYSQISDTDADPTSIMTLSDTSDTGYVHVVECREFLRRVALKANQDTEPPDAPFSLPAGSALRRKRSRVRPVAPTEELTLAGNKSSNPSKHCNGVGEASPGVDAVQPFGDHGGDSETPTPRPEPASSYLDVGVRRTLAGHSASAFHALAPLSSRRIRSCSPAPASRSAALPRTGADGRRRQRCRDSSPNQVRRAAFGPPKRIQKSGQSDGSRGRAPWRRWADSCDEPDGA